MPHVQTKLDEATFKEVKKDAIDKDMLIQDYVKEAVVERLERSKSESEVSSMSEEAKQKQTN